MRTQSLKTLVTIARIGSFVKTADELNSTLSTVSMQMKSLEEELDCILFDRSFRPPKLNPLGRKVADQATRILEQETRMIRTCAGEEALVGQYRLGFIATASVRLLPAFLRNAASRVPNASFEIETGLSENLEVRVQSGQLDAAVVTASDRPPANLHYSSLKTEPLVFAVPKGHAGQTVEKVAGNLAFLQFNPGSGIGKLIENFVGKHLPHRSETIVLDSVEAIMECVNQGIGFTLLSRADAERYGETATGFVMLEQGMPTRHLVLVTPDRNSEIPVREALTELFD